MCTFDELLHDGNFSVIRSFVELLVNAVPADAKICWQWMIFIIASCRRFHTKHKTWFYIYNLIVIYTVRWQKIKWYMVWTRWSASRRDWRIVDRQVSRWKNAMKKSRLFLSTQDIHLPQTKDLRRRASASARCKSRPGNEYLLHKKHMRT